MDGKPDTERSGVAGFTAIAKRGTREGAGAPPEGSSGAGAPARLARQSPCACKAQCQGRRRVIKTPRQGHDRPNDERIESSGSEDKTEKGKNTRVRTHTFGRFHA